MEESGLDPIVAEALLADETRPRVVPRREGLLVILRGVNLDPGADPEDMVALCDRLIPRAGNVLEELEDEVEALQDQVLSAESHKPRPKLAGLRRRAVAMHRYLAPQREALSRLLGERVTWLDESDRLHLREIADRTTRYVEELDSARERAAVTQEELNSRLAEGMNQRMCVVALVAAIFLPLGLLTGLLEINVGGIPGAENRLSFALVCMLLVALAQLPQFRGRFSGYSGT